ncbi:MAG: hypothetical protein IJ991_05750, partial [Thermoguttaceae bacterium]|nr:hypothetical protein [Thermoguttaceae bacterium]
MDELIPLFLRTGNKEALFAVFWATLGREPGKLADVDFATLRDLAERSGVKLTESQVRKRVDELKKLGILDVAPRRERGRFDLYVYRPAPFAAEAEKPEPATPLFDAAFGVGVESFAKPTDAAKPTVPVFAAVSETETRTESVAPVAADHFREAAKMIQTPTFAEVRDVRATSTIPAVASVAPEPSESETVAPPLEEINNNKYIKNKTINKPAKDLEAETQAGPEACSVAGTQPGLEPERRQDVADVRSLVDFESPKVAALRREIAERVWEPTVHPDLIDRLTAAVALRVGGATRSTVFALIREARDEKTLYERSNGKAGKRTIWQTATLRLKRLFENAGWVWSPTRFADEPRPSDVRRQARPLERAQTPEETTATPENAETLSVEELATTAAGFDASELDLSFADFSRLVARRRGIADACESRGVALEIRNALR